MIKINNNNVIFVDQIVQYKKCSMRETTYFKSKTYKKFVCNSFLKALFSWDFSKKDVTIYYDGVLHTLFEIGDWNDLVAYCNQTDCFSIIDGKIYEMPHIKLYLTDGSEQTMFFKSNQEMRKMERQIITKKKKH